MGSRVPLGATAMIGMSQAARITRTSSSPSMPVVCRSTTAALGRDANVVRSASSPSLASIVISSPPSRVRTNRRRVVSSGSTIATTVTAWPPASTPPRRSASVSSSGRWAEADDLLRSCGKTPIGGFAARLSACRYVALQRSPGRPSRRQHTCLKLVCKHQSHTESVVPEVLGAAKRSKGSCRVRLRT